MNLVHRVGRLAFFGLGITFALNTTGVHETVYHHIQTKRLAREGTAHMYFRDSDGIRAVLMSHENPSHKLTRIPDLPLLKPEGYGHDFTFELYDLKTGLYDFKATVWDFQGNVEDKSFRIQITNPDGGLDDLLNRSKRYEPPTYAQAL